MKKLTRVERKKRKRKFFYGIIILLILISVGVMIAVETDFFIIDNIKISGNNKIKKDRLIEASYINKEEDIFRVNTKLATENIKQLPYTKEVIVKRKIPKTIEIEIKERIENVQIKDDSSFILIDKEGQILDVKDTKDENLPTIIGLNINDKSIKSNVFLQLESDLEVEFFKESLNVGILNEFKDIYMENNDNINIRLNNNIKVEFGNLYNIKYKLSLLNEVLEYIKEEEIQSTMILMNKGDNPIIVTDEGE